MATTCRSSQDDSGSHPSGVWYILSPTDTSGLLHGLPQRLAQAIVEAERSPTPSMSPSESGQRGGDVRLTIEYVGPVEEPAIVGSADLD
jgi:hypothetical protein